MIVDGLENVKTAVEVRLGRKLYKNEAGKLDVLYNGKTTEIASVRVEHIKGTISTMNVK